MERDEELEGVLRVGLAGAALDLLLDLVFPLLPVTCEAEQLVLVCPENRLVLPHIHAGHDVVEVDNGILGAVADHDEEAALLLLEAIADEGRDPRVSGFVEKCQNLNWKRFVSNPRACLAYTVFWVAMVADVGKPRDETCD